MLKRFCDRCNKEICHYVQIECHSIDIKIDKKLEYNDINVDLCTQCADKLLDFLKNKKEVDMEDE